MSTLRADPRYFAAGPGARPLRAQPAAELLNAEHLRAEQPKAAQAHPAQPRPAQSRPTRAAPSRLAFRLERLWLTPFVRLVVRLGLPVFALTLGFGFWLGDTGRRADLYAHYTDLKLAFQNRPEFRLERLAVSGASASGEGVPGARGRGATKAASSSCRATSRATVAGRG